MLRIYKAAAGSGKTYTLAKDYIRLLIGTCNEGENQYHLNLVKDRMRLRHDNRHRHILAVTFTRKATEEMKTRILNELQLLADPQGKSPYAEEMQSTYSCSRQDLAITAEMAMNQILFDYGNFQVSTIDAFFQRVLHTFARELDRQSDYSIELDDNAAMKSAVGSMLDEFNSQITEDSKLEKWLFQFLEEKIETGKKANILNRASVSHTELVKSLSTISMESFKPYATAMREYLNTDKITIFAKKVKEKRARLLNALASKAESMLNSLDWDQSKDVFKTRIQLVLNKKPLESLPGKTISAFLNDEGASAFTKKYKVDTTTHNAAIRSVLIEAYEVAQIIESLIPIEKSLTQLGFLAHAWKYLIQFSEDNNTLLISDTNELVNRIIANDDTPFIYERLGVQLGSFLIDEFQDTSEMQWNNLRPLIANGLGSGYDSLVIGDEKQSIYRFRNSDSSILHHHVGAAFEKYLDPDYSNPQRSTNYRSSATVIRFNNSLFSLMAPAMGVVGFENVVQNISKRYKDQAGYVRFSPLPKKEKKSKDGEADPEGLDNKSKVKDYVFDQMAQEILRQLQSGYKGQDIAILTNNNSEAADVVNYLLTSHLEDIKVVSDEAMRITSSTAVQLIVSMLRIMDQEQINAAQPERDPAKGMSRAEVALAINRFEYLLSKEEEEEKPRKLTEILRQALNNKGSDPLTHSLEIIKQQKPASLVALVEAIIGSQISEADRKSQFAFIAAFQDMVIDYVSRFDGSLHSFLDWWDATGKKCSIPGTVDPDAVRVMTLHKSKGLEFQCVHIPLCTWNRDLNSYHPPQLWIECPPIDGIDPDLLPPALFVTLDKSTSSPNPHSIFYPLYLQEKQAAATDTLNKTYVGFTRAQRELLVWFDDAASSIGKVIKDMLAEHTSPELIAQGLGLDFSEYIDSDTGILSIGSPTVPDPEKAEPKSMAGKDTWEEYPVHFRADSSRDIISVDDVFDIDRDIDNDSATSEGKEPHLAGVVVRQADEEARFEGVVLHDIMSGIHTAADLERATSVAAARNHLAMSSMKHYSRIVDDFLATDDPRIMRWYSDFAELYIEQPIYIPNKNHTRRPDRIVVNHDGSVDIIDYKFTEYTTHSGTPEQMRQVREYMALMREMGHTSVRGYLVYPRLSKIIVVKNK